MSCDVDHRCSSDPALLWLWCKPEAIALIQPLAWEPPYASDAPPPPPPTDQKKPSPKQKSSNYFIWIPLPLISNARDWTCILMDTCQIHFHCTTMGTLSPDFKNPIEDINRSFSDHNCLCVDSDSCIMTITWSTVNQPIIGHTPITKKVLGMMNYSEIYYFSFPHLLFYL